MKNKICKLSLFSLILACVAPNASDARVVTKNSNRSYADAYSQVNGLSFQQSQGTPTATTASATATLPVAVDDKKLANAILENTSTGIGLDDLEACAMIYPSGVFKWSVPESGIRHNPMQQCVSVVELRDATTNAVLATTTVAAGDAMKCNIDMFPESGLNPVTLSRVALPADAEPTMSDVESVMNEEQKQNAGLKIAAGAIISGLAGNMLAPKSAGDSKLLGTSKTQLVDTAIGAAAGAGVMAASTYSGKVAGDTIKSTAVNAASGMVVGNMLAGAGDNTVLATMKCDDKDCVMGNIAIIDTNGAITDGHDNATQNKFYFIKKGVWNDIIACSENNSSFEKCSPVSANSYTNKQCENYNGDIVACESIKDSEFNLISPTYNLDSETKNLVENGSNGSYIVLKQASQIASKRHAYAIFDDKLPTKIGGYKVSDWEDLQTKTFGYYYRNSDGSVGIEVPSSPSFVFEPMGRDASDGGLIDLSNQARLKGTITGGAAGGAIGGFAGYQGAKNEVSERWVSAVREYEDSLSNFVCMTGSRFLAKYNDYLEIPELNKSK